MTGVTGVMFNGWSLATAMGGGVVYTWNPNEQPPLFGKERNSFWMETFFFQIHRAYGNEVGGNPKTR